MPRKRLDLLLRILAEVRKHVANVRLLRVGESADAEQRQLARQLGVESAIVELRPVSREDLAAAYRFAQPVGPHRGRGRFRIAPDRSDGVRLPGDR